MANESLIAATDNPVDLNNNNDAKPSKADGRSDETADKHLNSNTGSPTDESDDLVLRLKKIILQQEQEEKAKQQVNEKQNNPEQSSREQQSDDKRPNGSSQSPSLERAFVEKVKESPKLARTLLNGNRSPKADKRSISQIKKSPVPSRKMINQTNNDINGKLTNGNTTAVSANITEVNQPLVKETVKKISDLAIDKVSQNGNPNGNPNGNLNDNVNTNGHANANSDVKISLNGKFLYF